MMHSTTEKEVIARLQQRSEEKLKASVTMTNIDFYKWRKSMKFTQMDAAVALGMSKNTITNYEAGRRREDGRSVFVPKHVEMACAYLTMTTEPKSNTSKKREKTMDTKETAMAITGLEIRDDSNTVQAHELATYAKNASVPSDVCGMNREGRSVWQPWVLNLSFMQQAVLASDVRAMDGWPKLHPGKHMMRWFRRVTLISSFEGHAILTAFGEGGGSFTGSAPSNMSYKDIADLFLDSRDSMGLHFFSHMMHAFQIVGYKHSDPAIRGYFYSVYERMVHALHLFPENQELMDRRLCDNLTTWRDRMDESLSCSD